MLSGKVDDDMDNTLKMHVNRQKSKENMKKYMRYQKIW